MDGDEKWPETLGVVERCIALYAARIADQHEIIKTRVQLGQDATLSKGLLELLIEVHGMHILRRDRLRAELTAAK